MKTHELLAGLPGEDLIRTGLSQWQSGLRTPAACLVAIARIRLMNAGVIPETAAPPVAEPELELYRLLRQEEGDAYSRYNAMLRELESFESALDHRLSRQNGK